ncbi:AMP-dependent synthetase/ligase [Propionibacteriaceae bacterium G1746]|uniref:AMP-dependent synthetase/ligase n=1 Tax=Aestuariimicrobium sp. G57 TaxID=3418485 RepID=UPI003C1EA41C
MNDSSTIRPQSGGEPLSNKGLVTEHLAVRHLAHLLAQTVEKHGGRVATRIRANADLDAAPQWTTQTYREFNARIQAMARALVRDGIQRGDRVALFANNCPEWSEVDFALLTVGAVPVPIYATSTPDQIEHIVRDSGARGIVVGGASESARVREARANLPTIEFVISIPALVEDDVTPLAQWLVPATDPDAAALDEQVAARMGQAASDDLASIIYTSGTTGDPKGVMLTHQAMIAQLEAVATLFTITPDDHSLCFLPLSHALERAWTTIVFAHGCMNTYLPNARQASQALVEVNPTLLVSVPKLYETVYKLAREKVASSAVKQKIFDWAFHVGGRLQHAYRKGREPGLWWRSQLPVADKLVFSNIRAAMGGPKTVLACGGAPIRKEVEEFFSAAGIQIFTGYGLTEASPLVSFNSRQAWKIGTAGRVMAGGELAIGAESEILYRGPNVMAGYWNNPEATAEAFHDDWLRTGDAGYIDNDDFLVITDRLKDIIVTVGGKNVAPQQIEGLVLADPLFEHAVLVGEGRPFLTLLVTPSMPQLREVAAMLGVHHEKDDELVRDQRILDAMRERVNQLTAKLPSHEQIRDLRASLGEVTMENGLLTPTLKVRRREVEKKFQEVIDDMYARLAEARRGHKADGEGKADPAEK